MNRKPQEADHFWQIVYASINVKVADPEETVRYCHGTFAHALDLIHEQRFKEADKKLRNLNYLIDCVKFNPEVQEIYHQAWAWIDLLDMPYIFDDAATITINFEIPPNEA